MADLQGTIFVACNKLTAGLRHDLRLPQRFKTCFKMLGHFSDVHTNRKSCRRPVVSLSQATKIVPCKSAHSHLEIKVIVAIIITIAVIIITIFIVVVIITIIIAIIIVTLVIIIIIIAFLLSSLLSPQSLSSSTSLLSSLFLSRSSLLSSSSS